MRLLPNPKKNVTPYVIPNPVGVDRVVKNIQEFLPTQLTWLEKSFNRATIMSRRDSEDDEIIFPAVSVGVGRDAFNCIGNDNWTGYSFFVAQSTETANDWESFADNNYQRDIDLYFWMNLSTIDNTKSGAELLEQLKFEVLDALSTVLIEDAYGIQVNSIEDNPFDVFSNFTLSATDTQSLYYPYGALKVNFTAIYSKLCV
jgi:hypothetical protein